MMLFLCKKTYVKSNDAYRKDDDMNGIETLPIAHYCVYAIQHNVTGRIYVGISKDLTSRINTHLSALRGGYHTNAMMQADFNEFGEDLSVFKLEEFDYPQYPYGDPRRTEYTRHEKAWMEKLGTNNPQVGYNVNDVHFRAKPKEYEIVDGAPTPNEP